MVNRRLRLARVLNEQSVNARADAPRCIGESGFEPGWRDHHDVDQRSAAAVRGRSFRRRHCIPLDDIRGVDAASPGSGNLENGGRWRGADPHSLEPAAAQSERSSSAPFRIKPRAHTDLKLLVIFLASMIRRPSAPLPSGISARLTTACAFRSGIVVLSPEVADARDRGSCVSTRSRCSTRCTPELG